MRCDLKSTIFIHTRQTLTFKICVYSLYTGRHSLGHQKKGVRTLVQSADITDGLIKFNRLNKLHENNTVVGSLLHEKNAEHSSVDFGHHVMSPVRFTDTRRKAMAQAPSSMGRQRKKSGKGALFCHRGDLLMEG